MYLRVPEKPQANHEVPAQLEEVINASKTPSEIEPLELDTIPPLRSGEFDDPDRDFYEQTWFRSMITLLMIGITTATCLLLFVLQPLSGEKGIQLYILRPSPDFAGWLPFEIFADVLTFAGFSLLLEDFSPTPRTSRIWRGILWTFSYGVFYGGAFAYRPRNHSPFIYNYIFTGFVGLYVALSFICIVREVPVSQV